MAGLMRFLPSAGMASPESVFLGLGQYERACVAIPFVLQCDWQEGSRQPLLAVFCSDVQGPWQSLSLLADTPSARAWLAGLDTHQALQAGLQAQGVATFHAGRPLALEPVRIPKPWGEEIWFTGIEKRGVSQVRPDCGHPVPLPWLLAAVPQYLLGAASASPPVLLKILAPWPHEGLGDLYLELHERKREVYIISAVDCSAWPDGVGAIRFGMDPQARAAHGDDESFREAFADAAGACEQHRREVDAWLDQRRHDAGIAEGEPAPPDWMQAQWQAMPAAWQQRELALKARLDAFTRLLPLRVGDVVQVPTLLPHSLQHGVRAVEFQTPVYERKVLAFGQKVLTQPAWDSREGAALMGLDAPDPAPLPLLGDAGGVRREQVVRFGDFAVDRLALAPGATVAFPAGSYRLLMGISGTLRAPGGETLLPEQAWLLPASVPLAGQAAQDAENTVFLEALPQLRG